jgi:2'-5' RNA ligase
MRLFLGVKAKIECYEEIKKERFNSFYGKWVEEENLHTTLYFFGEVKDSKDIEEKLQNIVFPKTKIELNGLGSFGYPPKILFADLKKNIYKKSHKKLEEIFGKTNKPFRPHVTLIRIKRILNDDYKKVLRRYRYKNIGYLEREVVLFKSTLTPKGPIYTVLKEM